MTQQDLSVVAEVSRKSINAIENGVYIALDGSRVENRSDAELPR